MIQTEEPNSHNRQVFKDTHGNNLTALQTSSDRLSNGRFVLWSDVLDAFPGVDHIEDRSNDPIVMRVFFVVDGSGSNQVYVAQKKT